jgi:hypothetical protein
VGRGPSDTDGFFALPDVLKALTDREREVR